MEKSLLPQMVKIAPNTPEKMRSTRESVIIQIIMLCVGIMTWFIHVFYRDVVVLLYSVTFLYVIVAIYIALYEIDWTAYKLSLTSFRGFCISISIITNWLCDILRYILLTKSDNEPFLTIIADNICFTITIMLMLACDASPRFINLIRFLAPFCAIVCIGIIIITKNILHPDVDHAIFTLYYGSLTLNDIEASAKVQIIWFAITFLWAVPRDPKHEHFVFLDNRIKIKTMIPKRKYVDAENNTLSKCLINGGACCGALYILIYIIGVSWRDYDDINISLVVIDIILVVMWTIIIVIFIYKHFQWYMAKQLVLQFRVNMLITTICILIYCAIQRLLWLDVNNMNAKIVIETLLNKIIFVLCCCCAIIRDGVNISYPTYVIIFYSFCGILVSIWNIYRFTFGLGSTEYPKWFLLIQKQAYFQVFVMSYLWLYYWWRDREGKYFSLIRKRKATQELWGDSDPMDHVRESFDIETPESTYISNNDSFSGFDLHQQL